ncbi:sugar ABC transporter ATP-binding protein, partial [Shimia thalassica]|nr:sugar ABC transporter ATP-binding protein [Shimia thalassica]
HTLSVVKEISDRITILRDGHWIGTKEASEMSLDAMAQMMGGRELSDLYPPMRDADVDADRVLQVANRTAAGVKDVSF